MSHRSMLLALALAMGALAPAQSQDVVKRKRKVVDLVWSSHKTKNYAVEFEQLITADVVNRIGTELEDILAEYVKIFRQSPSAPFKVQLLNNQNTFEQVGGDVSHPGFFSPADNVLVLLQRPYYDLIPTVYHEAFHQYLQFFIGNSVAIPTWYNEGMAMYFEGMQRDEKTRARALDSKLIDKRKLRMVQDAILTRTHVPLEKLIGLSHTDFHVKEFEGLNYHQSFSVACFLMDSTKGKAAIDFARTLKEKKDVEAAYDGLFGKERKNFKKLEASWKAYVVKTEIDRDPTK